MALAAANALDAITLRPATEADLPACEAIWRDALNGYLRPLGIGEVPGDNPALRRLHAHTLATDPDRFWVATPPGGTPVAFGSAVLRGPVWFLSMLFVNPDLQARGLGRAILQRILPAPADGTILATVTDAAQPISNALYASLGIVPRIPLFNFVGRPRDGWVPPQLPMGVGASQIDPTEPRDAWFVAERDALDRALLGYAHPEDHRFATHADQRTFAFRAESGRLIAHGGASVGGRVGPIAVEDPALLAPVLGHLLRKVEPRGASVVYVSGSAGDAFRLALDAGLRIDGFPLLACWSSPFVDLARYVPISPGLL